MNIIGYAVDGDIYCAECLDRDGVDYDNVHRDDIAALFSDHETDYPVHCGNCREFLGGVLTRDGLRWLKEQWLVHRWRDRALMEQYMYHYGGDGWHFVATPWGWADPFWNIED